jgi:hypothetical protein
VCLEHADSIADGTQSEKLHTIISQAKEWLHMWEGRKPTGNSPEERLRRSEIVGMHGSTYKRIALLLLKASGKEDDEVKKYYRKALEHYREAMGEAAATGMSYYWTATQYLSLQAILHTRKLVVGITPSPQIFELARSLANRDLDAADNNSTRAWAHGTLAELELLSLFHQPDVPHADSEAEIADHCRKIVELMGPRSFHVGSTVRQFKRYNDAWGDDLWGALARKAIEILEPEPGVDYDWPEDYS